VTGDDRQPYERPTLTPDRPLAGYEARLVLVVRGEVVTAVGRKLYRTTGRALPAGAPVDVPHVDVTEHLADGSVRRTLWALP